MKRWFSSIALSLVLAIIAVWCSLELRSGREAQAWDEAKHNSETPVVSMLAIEMDSDPRELVRLGRIYNREIFPPDEERARAAFEGAIYLAPLWSVPWYELARVKLLEGDAEGAEMALSRSDELDPHRAEGRVGAIELWSVLGHPDRALSLAKRISVEGGMVAAWATQQLRRIGMSSEEIYGAIAPGLRAPEAKLDLLTSLSSTDYLQNAALLGGVDPNEFDDAQVRRLLTLSLTPLVPEEAYRFWSKLDPTVECFSTTRSLCLSDPDLLHGSFGLNLPVGWQPLQHSHWVRSRWVPTDVAGEIEGLLEFELIRANQKQRALTFYRLPLPSTTRSELKVRVRAEFGAGPMPYLIVNRTSTRLVSAPIDVSHGRWQEVLVDLPLLDASTVVDLGFLFPAATSAGNTMAEGKIWIDGLEFVDPLLPGEESL